MSLKASRTPSKINDISRTLAGVDAGVLQGIRGLEAFKFQKYILGVQKHFLAPIISTFLTNMREFNQILLNVAG